MCMASSGTAVEVAHSRWRCCTYKIKLCSCCNQRTEPYGLWCRTLAIAYRDIFVPFSNNGDGEKWNSDGSSAHQMEKDLTLIAVVGIQDPLRPQVPASIAQCHRAGITVRMLTGELSVLLLYCCTYLVDVDASVDMLASEH